jgi:hypothetical protein
MARNAKEAGASGGEAALQRVRDLNESILDQARRTGKNSLQAYERLLKSVADYQEKAGKRSGDFVSALGRAQADLTREVAEAGPSAVRRVGGAVGGATGGAAKQARKVPGVSEAEGEVRGAGATSGDLPIKRYESLNASEVVKQLPRLSEVDLGKVDAYERKHRNRKTVRNKIASLRGEQA